MRLRPMAVLAALSVLSASPLALAQAPADGGAMPVPASASAPVTTTTTTTEAAPSGDATAVTTTTTEAPAAGPMAPMPMAAPDAALMAAPADPLPAPLPAPAEPAPMAAPAPLPGLAPLFPAKRESAPAYVSVFGGWVSPDGGRAQRNGPITGAVFGIPLAPNFNLELNGFFRRHRENPDFGGHDRQYGGGADLMGFVGTRRNWIFALLGGGAARENLHLYESATVGYADAGVGFVTFFGKRFALRTEGKANYFFNRTSYAGQKGQLDFSATAGLTYLFEDRRYQEDMVLPPPPVVEDSDGDGVRDQIDQCPGTPPNTPVDSQGCPLPTAPLDSDGDGVPDAADACPGTAPGTPVDARGCDLVVAPVSNDDDHDGVPNGTDLCPTTPLGMKVDATGCIVEQTMVLQGVNFMFNSDRLTLNAEKILDGVADSLRQNSSLRLEVAGHTDAIGPQSYNLGLSQRRARAVKAYLVGKGIDGGRLEAEGFGEANPIASNDNDEGRARNRRVEFRVYK